MALPAKLQENLLQKGVPLRWTEKWGELAKINKFYLPAAVNVVDQVQNIEVMNHKTMDELYDDKNRVSLAQVEHYMDQESALTVIADIISNAAQLIAVGKKFRDDGEMLIRTSIMILEEYPKMTLAELKFVLRKGVAGKWGELYDRFDGNTVLIWCGKFWEEKLQHGQYKSESRHKHEKESR